MPVTAESYFTSLKNYLCPNYQIVKRDSGRLVLEEEVYWAGETKAKKHKVRLPYNGEAIVVRLDLKNRSGNSDPLFHFFKDDSKPWAKRCDFVVFQLVSNRLNIYCIEFKSGSLPESLCQQLEASEAWCRAIHAIIKSYTGKAKRLNLRKFVFSCIEQPERFCDEEGYLNSDHSIRHIHYDDVRTMALDDLTNPSVELIG
ncbi:MAG: hypothetical protein K6L73_10155 [Cellvibrionaceae bacterium]